MRVVSLKKPFVNPLRKTTPPAGGSESTLQKKKVFLFNFFVSCTDTAGMAHQKKRKFLWFVILCVGGGGLYLNKDQILPGLFPPSAHKNNLPPQKHSVKNVKTIRQAVRENSLNLRLKKGFRDRKVLSGHFDSPSGEEDSTDLLPRELETDSVFEEDHNAKVLSQDLAPLDQEDIYADPENRIRRDLLHQVRLQKEQQKTAEQERQKTLEDFVKKARSQGYQVLFQKNGEVLLEPLPPQDSQNPSLP